MKTVKNLLEKVQTELDQDVVNEFNKIIVNKVEDYGKNKAALKSFLEDMQHGGCISGMIGEFIYHAECKEFYIKFIDELEEFKQLLDDEIGEAIKNRHNLPHYTFIV